MRNLLQTTLLLVVFIALAKESFAQNLKTKWVQEFETNMDIVDVPLVEGDFVYVHLRKGGDKFGGGSNFLQKRKISDNSLVNEIEINFISDDGKQMTFFEYPSQGIQEINSELYVITSYVSKKKKTGYVLTYKLNKEKLEFELDKIVFETPVSNEKISAYSFLLKQKNEKLIVFTVTKSPLKIGNPPISENYYVISKNGTQELDAEKYCLYDILDCKYRLN